MDPEFSNENEKNDASSISSDLIRGHINTIILRTLYDGDKYGYEIINEIEEKSKGQYSLKQPTLYSALKRLESQDFVTSYWGGVSNGGRRKYFQITDKGRKVVEQNLAEWEYSRTVIDSLISEKDYDFSTPPPSGNVDFNLLKKSTTRVVIPGGEDENDAFDFTFGNGEISDASAAEDDTPIQGANETQEEQFGVQSAAQDLDANDEAPPLSAVQSEPAPSPAADHAPLTDAAPEESCDARSAAAEVSETDRVTETPRAEEKVEEMDEEQRRRIHDNYQALFGNTDSTAYYYANTAPDGARQSAPRSDMYEDTRYGGQAQAYYSEEAQYYADQNAYYADAQPYSEPYPSHNAQSEMSYYEKSPAERNYKDLISKLYGSTADEPETLAEEEAAEFDVPTEPAPKEPEPEPEKPVATEVRSSRNIEFFDIEECAENDGLKITTASGTNKRGVTTVNAPIGDTFNKGKTLFVTAVYVFFIALAESILNICLMGLLNTNLAYVVLPFVFDFIMLGVFLFLYLRGYGRNCLKSQSRSYISASFILFINLVLIICLIAFLIINMNYSSIAFREVLLYAIFPCIYAFNIPLFAMLYSYNANKD